MRAHSKKVMLVKWHPTAEFTLASASLDGTVKVWDIQSEKTTMDYVIGGIPWSMNWNYNGSQLATISKDKKMHVFDPRK
jgi:coronin-1B/1C/6